MRDVLITRPPHLIVKKKSLLFNFIEFEFLEIDLKHINQGRLFARQTNFTSENVIEITSALIENEFLSISDRRNFGVDHCSYFAKIGFYKEKKYKIIFCVCSDRPTTLGIITLFRVGKNESV